MQLCRAHTIKCIVPEYVFFNLIDLVFKPVIGFTVNFVVWSVNKWCKVLILNKDLKLDFRCEKLNYCQ